MTRAFAAALLMAAAGCAPEKLRRFEIGLIGPVGPGVGAAARAAGLTVREAAPEGADTYDAVVAVKDASGGKGSRLADWSDLRRQVALAAVRRRTGVFFLLPESPEGRELTDFPEEWQALARLARETGALRGIVESGAEAEAPFAAPPGVAVRAWRFQGRLYVLLVNDAARPAAIDPEALRPWRALFEVRSDPRDLLVACGGGRCLPGERALWLEGRL